MTGDYKFQEKGKNMNEDYTNTINDETINDNAAPFSISDEQYYSLMRNAINPAIPFTDSMVAKTDNPYATIPASVFGVLNRAGQAFAGLPADIRTLYAALFNPEEYSAIQAEKEAAGRQGYGTNLSFINALQGKPNWIDYYMNWVNNSGISKDWERNVYDLGTRALGMTPYVLAGEYMPMGLARLGLSPAAAQGLTQGYFGASGLIHETPNITPEGRFTGYSTAIDLPGGVLMAGAPYLSGLAGSTAARLMSKVPSLGTPLGQDIARTIGQSAGFGAAFTAPEMLNAAVAKQQGKDYNVDTTREFLLNSLMGLPFSGINAAKSLGRLIQKPTEQATDINRTVESPLGLPFQGGNKIYETPEPAYESAKGVAPEPSKQPVVIKPASTEDFANAVSLINNDIGKKADDVNFTVENWKQFANSNPVAKEKGSDIIESKNVFDAKTEELRKSLREYEDINKRLQELSKSIESGQPESVSDEYNKLLEAASTKYDEVTNKQQEVNDVLRNIKDKESILSKTFPDYVPYTKTYQGVDDYINNTLGKLQQVTANAETLTKTPSSSAFLDELRGYESALKSQYEDFVNKRNNNQDTWKDIHSVRELANKINENIESFANTQGVKSFLFREPSLPKEPPLTKSEIDAFSNLYDRLGLNRDLYTNDNIENVVSSTLSDKNINLNPDIVKRFTDYIKKFQSPKTKEERNASEVSEVIKSLTPQTVVPPTQEEKYTISDVYNKLKPGQEFISNLKKPAKGPVVKDNMFIDIPAATEYFKDVSDIIEKYEGNPAGLFERVKTTLDKKYNTEHDSDYVDSVIEAVSKDVRGEKALDKIKKDKNLYPVLDELSSYLRTYNGTSQPAAFKADIARRLSEIKDVNGKTPLTKDDIDSISTFIASRYHGNINALNRFIDSGFKPSSSFLTTTARPAPASVLKKKPVKENPSQKSALKKQQSKSGKKEKASLLGNKKKRQNKK